MRNLIVFYWLSDDKAEKLAFNHFTKHCASKGIELVRLDFGISSYQNGIIPIQNGTARPTCLFIHKLNDLVLEAESGDELAMQSLANFEQWVNFHTEIDIIDQLPLTRVLLNRVTMSKAIETTCSTLDQSVFFIPPFCELRYQDEALTQLNENAVQFPIICKPVMAESHDIVVVTSEEGLSSAPYPCVAQNFIGHYQLLYKMYILGDRLYCVERPSLPDPSELKSMGIPALHFNTSALGKGPPSAFDSDRRKVFSNGVTDKSALQALRNANNVTSTLYSKPTSQPIYEPNPHRPSSEKLRILATALRSSLNLELFGADVIVDADTGRLACVDVNTFPGYKGIPDFFSELSSFLVRRSQNQVAFESQLPIFIS